MRAYKQVLRINTINLKNLVHTLKIPGTMPAFMEYLVMSYVREWSINLCFRDDIIHFESVRKDQD